MHRPVGDPAHGPVVQAHMTGYFRECVQMTDMRVADRRIALRPAQPVRYWQQPLQCRPVREPLRSWGLHPVPQRGEPRCQRTHERLGSQQHLSPQVAPGRIPIEPGGHELAVMTLRR